MESDRVELATVIVHMVSLFGFTTNIIAIITIVKSIKLHTSFGILCAAQAANNSFVLVLNSIWYLMPDSGIFAVGSMISRIVGMIGLSLWVAGIRFHILISLNRLLVLAFPFASQRFINSRSTSGAVAIALLASFLQCAPLVLVDDLWFGYDHGKMQWIFAPNDLGRFYEANVNYLPITIEFGCVLLLDIITVVYLRFARSKAFSQSIPLLITFIFFAFVTPLLSDQFGKFLSTTVMWHLAHGIDGLIVDLFHTRLNLFKKGNEAASSTFSVSFVQVL